MRSASRLFVLALALGAAGCSTVSQPFSAIRAAITPSESGATPAAGSRSAAARPSPVSAAAQRAFDEAGALLRSGRTEEAERALRAMTQAYPDLAGPHANLGLAYRRTGKLDEAAKELELAVSLSPAQPIYVNELGVVYRQQGQFAKARDAYQRAIVLDPGYAAPTLNLGILYDLYLGDAAQALEQYSRYLALSPSGDAMVTRWVVELKNRKPAPITVSRQEKP